MHARCSWRASGLRNVSEVSNTIYGEYSQLKEDGGAAPPSFFCARSIALRLSLGATVGVPVLATLIVSRRLCPGTPSNVFLRFSSTAGRRSTGFSFSGSLIPSRKAAAFVMRGATAGAAVLATWMVLERLCPGTFSNVCARRSLPK